MSSSLRNISISPRVLIALFVTLSTLMVLTAWIDLRQSRSELRTLMTDQAHTLIESLQASAANALNANKHLDDALRQRLLDNANFIRQLYHQGQVNDALLVTLSAEHSLHRIRIVATDGTWLFSSHPRKAEHDSLPRPRADLTPIFNGQADTLIIGIRQARAESGFRHGVALAARDRSAILVNMDAAELLKFRHDIGLGPLLRSIATDSNIVYVALQDTAQILAAAGETDFLTEFKSDPFLLSALDDTVGHEPPNRILDRDSVRVLEIVHRFSYGDRTVGLFRLGLSFGPLEAIDARVVRRLLVVTVIILIVGFLVLTFIIATQNADLIKRQFRAVETYSSQVIRNVGDGILVFNKENGIQTLNMAAQQLLRVDESAVLGAPVVDLLGSRTCRDFLDSPAVRDQVACVLPHGTVHLLMAKSSFVNEDGQENTILIVRDQTRLKLLEEQIKLRERTHEMAALASGLAHEIRNPLNAVGMIVQQLRKDFRPTEDAAGYEELTTIVYEEVRRINDAVQSFLKTVRPTPPRPEPFEVAELLRFIERSYDSVHKDGDVELIVDEAWSGTVGWDQDQMRQVLINLVQNAFEASEAGDRIVIAVSEPEPGFVEISVADRGSGIPVEIRDRIYNLYFTTKASGTGIGLAIVQRIIVDHGGTIVVETTEGRGTTFFLRLPQQIPTITQVEPGRKR